MVSVADLLDIEIVYRTWDRFGSDQRLGEPNIARVQRVVGEIAGVLDYEPERRVVSLGSVRLGRIDLYEVGDAYMEVLDAVSSEWTAYVDVVEAERYVERFLLVVDLVEVAEWARGHGIGLHAVARAIRTWGEESLVVMIAWPPGAEGPEGRAAGEALARHWSRLGLARFGDGSPPVLSGSTDSPEVEEALVALCDWHSPQAAS